MFSVLTRKTAAKFKRVVKKYPSKYNHGFFLIEEFRYGRNFRPKLRKFARIEIPLIWRKSVAAARSHRIIFCKIADKKCDLHPFPLLFLNLFL